MCDANSSLRVRELDPHGEPLEEARVIPGRSGKTNPEMTKTPIWYCCYDLSTSTINALQDFGLQGGFFIVRL